MIPRVAVETDRGGRTFSATPSIIPPAMPNLEPSTVFSDNIWDATHERSEGGGVLLKIRRPDSAAGRMTRCTVTRTGHHQEWTHDVGSWPFSRSGLNTDEYEFEFLNRPGIPGDSIPWKRGWSHGQEATVIEAVSA